MLYRVRILGRDIEPLSASVSYAQNSVEEFEVLVPMRFLNGLDLYLAETILYIDGTALITGFVYDEPELEVDGNIVIAKLPCYGPLGYLMNKAAYSSAHYQNQTLIAIMTDLLNTHTDDWEVGDVSTMVDNLVKTTVDLREKETRWAQVIEAAKAVPDVLVRYGGINGINGKHRLDIGIFGEHHPIGLVEGSTLLSLQKHKTGMERIRYIEPYGGKANDVTVIKLSHALGYSPSLASHATYPIVTHNGAQMVQNNTVTVGVERRRDYDDIVTKGDTPPTTTQINQAGYALWQQCVREFQNGTMRLSFNAKARLDSIPAINDMIYLQSAVRERAWDRATQRQTSIETFNVADWLYITSLDIKLDDGGIDLDLKLQDSPFAESQDSSLQLYGAVESVGKFKTDSSSLAASAITVTVQQVGVASNCTQTGGTLGRTFTVARPTAPVGKTKMVYVVEVSPTNAVVEIVQEPVYDPAVPANNRDFIACVSLNGTWDTSSDVTLTVYFIYS